MAEVVILEAETMKRVWVLILVSCLAPLALRAVGPEGAISAGKGEDYKVEVLGRVHPESIVLHLVERRTGDIVLAISLKDLSRLNDDGVIVYPEVYDLVCSYIGEDGSALSVSVRAVSRGLSADNGRTFPIELSFVPPYGDGGEIDWGDAVLTMSDTAVAQVVGSFRLRLRNRRGESIAAGVYTGTIDFQLTSE